MTPSDFIYLPNKENKQSVNITKQNISLALHLSLVLALTKKTFYLFKSYLPRFFRRYKRLKKQIPSLRDSKPYDIGLDASHEVIGNALSRGFAISYSFPPTFKKKTSSVY